MDALNSSADVAVVLVATSYMDASLVGMLHKRLIDSSVSNRLLEARGPLGTFAARADAAYALGLIGKKMYQTLVQIAEIRNEFAHHHLELKFADPKVADLCGKPTFIEALFTKPNDSLVEVAKQARDRFMVTAVLLS